MLRDKATLSDNTKDLQDNKHLLALIALFDGDFSIDWIVELADCRASRVITVLEEAVRRENLLDRGSGIYTFSDLTERERWAGKIDVETKKDFHNRIAEFLFRELPEDDEKALVVSHHLLNTENGEERCRYLARAGDTHLRKFKTQQAFQCYAKVLENLSDAYGDGIDALFSETAIKYSKISTARHDTLKVFNTLKDALSRAIRLRNDSNQALLEMHIAKNEWLMGKYTSAMRHFDTGWSIACEIDDSNLRRSASAFSTFFLYWQGRFKEAVESYEKSMPDVEKHPNRRFPVLATITLGYCYAQIGQVTQGLGMIDAVRTLCLEREDLNLASYTAGNMGCIMLDILKVDEAIAHMKIAIREAGETNNKWVLITGHLVMAHCYYLKGENKRCGKHLNSFLKQRKEIQAVVNLFPYLLELLWAMEQGKLTPIKGHSLKQEVDRTIRSRNYFMKGVAYRYQALLRKSDNEPQKKIIQSLELSMKWLVKSGHQFQTAETSFELTRSHLLLGNRKKARELTVNASKMLVSFTEMPVPDDLRGLIEAPPVNEQLLKEILHLGQKIADVVYSDDLISQVLAAVNRMTGAERCALFQLDERGGDPKFRLQASKNLTSAQIAHPNFTSSMKMLEEVAQTGKGRIIETDPEDDTAFFSNENIRSRICVPMVLRNKVVGVLYNDNRLLSSAFKNSDLDLLAFFAAQAAFAMDNAKAYNEIKLLNQRLHQEKEYYREEHTQNIKSNDMIGESSAIKQVLAQAKQVAETEATALILGQTGVGKELVAKAIHNQSPRKDKPFIRVHCSALPENLIPSELFGHEKGAFTGAVSRRIGRFELADCGTLFLDEIGDIPPDIQVRLLRVLQTREFERVGGSETLQSDFRLITATNRDLEKEVVENRFRADLYYRLNVFPIQVPPLKERKSDIPLLVHHFLKQYSIKMRKKLFNRISKEEMDKLMRYDWPGNVRELENVIERGVILSSGPGFRMPELDPNRQEEITDENTSLREIEKRHILLILDKTAWKIRGPGGAAELLEIHPSTLHFRMKKLGIQKKRS
ncbi:MAG: GAF domain-containing protein [Proteobacteria bacterium]|nr:GAF domain-containing protein [Pseudomonadota bacterium]